MLALSILALAVCTLSAKASSDAQSSSLDTCPGYKASNVKTTGWGLSADLTLAGKACNAFGDDLKNLQLTVEYQTGGFLILLDIVHF